MSGKKIKQDTLAYLGGLFDSDGCFCIRVSDRKSSYGGKRYISFGPMARVGWAKYAEKTLIEIKEEIGIGKIYYSNSYDENAVVFWQTTNWQDTLDLCKLLLPYVRLKKSQCIRMIEACELFIGENVKSRKNKSRDLMKKMAHYATTMNPELRQTKRYRDKYNYEYWCNKIDEIFDDNKSIEKVRPTNKGGMPPKYSIERIKKELSDVKSGVIKDKHERDVILKRARYRFGKGQIKDYLNGDFDEVGLLVKFIY